MVESRWMLNQSLGGLELCKKRQDGGIRRGWRFCRLLHADAHRIVEGVWKEGLGSVKQQGKADVDSLTERESEEGGE